MQVLCECKDDVKYPKKDETLCIKPNDFTTYKLKKTKYVHRLSYRSIKSFTKMSFPTMSMTSICSIFNDLIDVIAIYLKCYCTCLFLEIANIIQVNARDMGVSYCYTDN